jgi:hypothetical protein
MRTPEDLERIARLYCKRDGVDPDEVTSLGVPGAPGDFVRRWQRVLVEIEPIISVIDILNESPR